MLGYLSNQIVDSLFHKGAIRQEDREIYVYGYQIIISSLFGIILIGCLGLLLNRLPESLTFLVIFISTRQFCGGYHAKTFVKCCVLFVLSYLMILLLMELIYDRIELYHIICLMLFYLIMIFKYAPIESANKRLSRKTIAVNRKKSIVLSLFWLLIAVGLYPWSRGLSLMITLTLILVAILIIAANFERRIKHEEVADT